MKLDIVGSVLLREPVDFFCGCGGIGEQREGAAIGRRCEEPHGRFKALESEFCELHVFHDRGERRAAGMRERGTAEAGMKLFGDGCAANNRAAFEDEGPETFLREIERGDESVVAGAENHDIALDGHYFRPASFRISSAARRPGAPMIPPPG